MGKWVWRWGHLKEPRTSVTSTEIINVIKPKSLTLWRHMRHKNQMKRCAHAGDQGKFTRRVRFILDQKMSIAGRIALWEWRWSVACTFLMRGRGLGVHTVLMDHRPPVEWSHNGPSCHTPEHWWHPMFTDDTDVCASAVWKAAEAQTFLWLGFTKQNSYKQDPDSPTIPAPRSKTRWFGDWNATQMSRSEWARSRRTRGGFRRTPVSKEIRGWYTCDIFRSC